MLKNGSDIAGMNARARIQHTMRRWAQDEAKAIEKAIGHSDKVTAADRFASQQGGGRVTATSLAAVLADRLNTHGSAVLERRWSFVVSQCALYGVTL